MSKINARKANSRDDEDGSKNLNPNERLALIGLIEEGSRIGSSDHPIVADLFSELWDLVHKTISGSKIDHLKPEGSSNGFQVFELNAEQGENLGRLHMLYLNKPMPCYYLVYVEVAPPFRNKGLGNRIIEAFGDFLAKKNALGILDNIIPPDDPTYDIYLKKEWRPVHEIIKTDSLDPEGVYMVFIPASMRDKDLSDPIQRLVHHIQRKRASIDMRENELMVRRTIEEFKELHAALLAYFDTDIKSGEDSAIMRFMFTRFVTKVVSFRRRIGSLLGYTGGESMEQIVLDPFVASLPVQSYAPGHGTAVPTFVAGDRELWLKLPEVLKKHPARIIESYPNYRRPSLISWMQTKGLTSSDMLTIGDLMDLGFDPTRLKEINIDGKKHIFERIQARRIQELVENMSSLNMLADKLKGERVNNALLRFNAPLLIVRDSGNAYVLRRKVEGIHWEEAVEQLQTNSSLKALNQSMKVDKRVKSTIAKAINKAQRALEDGKGFDADRFAYFVAWNIVSNTPILQVDMTGSFLESVWIV